MTPDDVNLALWQLVSENALSLPYGVAPILIGTVDEARWNDARWNPAQGQKGYASPDITASGKPSWEMITGAFARAMHTRETLLIHLDDKTTEAIIVAYDANSRNKEINLRLAGEHTPAQDAERIRLIARCHAVEAAIESADTLEKRQAIRDMIDDGTWANEPGE